MEQIHVTLPDGSVKDVPKGTTPAEIARSISPRLADAALVARVAAPNDGEGELIDLRRPLEQDVKLRILTEKDPDSLFVFRHSAAQDLPNERKLMPKPEALALYRKTNQIFKCELVEEKASEPMVSFYTTGKFIDFCRGPHIPSTKRIQAFKLMSVAG